MLSKEMEKALNGQINAEFYSAYLYLSMGAYFEAEGLPGCANWMKMQFQEEWMHGSKIYDYVVERGGRVLLGAIEKPRAEWESPLAVFEHVLEHERKVTGLINALADQALDERDHATSIFLQWFISEQVEEEATASGLVDRMRLIGGDSAALLALDQELAARVFTPPAKE
jgi:ferritin